MLRIGPWLGATQDELKSIREGGDSSRFEYWFGPVNDDKLSYFEDLLRAIYLGAIANAHYPTTRLAMSLSCNKAN